MPATASWTNALRPRARCSTTATTAARPPANPGRTSRGGIGPSRTPARRSAMTHNGSATSTPTTALATAAPVAPPALVPNHSAGITTTTQPRLMSRFHRVAPVLMRMSMVRP